MDLDAMYFEKSESRSKDADAVAFRKGVLTTGDKEFIRQNCDTMTDAEIAKVIGRTTGSVEGARRQLGLIKGKRGAQGVRKPHPKKSRRAYVAMLDDQSKKSFFLQELRKSALYKALRKALKNHKDRKDYVQLYEEKWIDFITDPSVETVTSMERDTWHEMTIAQIREMVYLEREGEPVIIEKGGRPIEVQRDYSKEIAACQDQIRKAQVELNVTRQQRLKDRNDQAKTFTEVIKELRNPEIRRKAGDAAAMFKYIAERDYNNRLGKNIISGNSAQYDVDANFVNGKEPENLNGDFTGHREIEKNKVAEKVVRETIVATTGSEEDN